MASTSVSVRAPAILPGLLPAEEVDQLADDLASSLEMDDFSRFTMARLPSIAERQMLQKRVGDLEEVLSGIGPGSTASPGGQQWQQARRALGALFAGYPSLRNANVPEMLDTYLAWMMDLPAFAIAEACGLLGRGQAKWTDPHTGEVERQSLHHPPSTSLFFTLAQPLALRHREKLAQIEKVLRVKQITPPVPSEAERARVGAQMQELADSLKRPMRAAVVDEKQEELDRVNALARNQNIAAAWRAEGYEPMFNEGGGIASPGLLKSQGLWPPAGAKKLAKGGG